MAHTIESSARTTARDAVAGDAPRLIPPAREAVARAARRLSFGFGRRFFLLLAIGLVWLGPAWFEPRFLVAMGVWDLLVVAAWAYDLALLPRPHQLLVRRVWSAPVGLSMDAQVRLEVKNSAGVSIHIDAIDDAPAALRREPAELSFPAAAGRAGEGAYRIHPVHRGDCGVAEVYLRYQSALRIAERWAVADLRQFVRVYPNFDEARRHTIYLIRSRQIELEKRRQRLRGQGREFESLREYRDGDEWRDICWSATARRGKLITRIFQIERSQAVWIVIDAGRLLRARVGGLSKLDYAVNTALALAQVALYSGDRVGLLAYGRRVQQRLAPARGAWHLREMVERLALVQSEGVEADHLRAARTLMAAQKSRSLVVWLTDLAETAAMPDVIESALHMTGKHLVLFAALGQPELGRLAAERPEDVEGMYSNVAALEVVHRRELLLRQLRERGALALEIDPGRLSTAVVNHYLDIKERSLL